MHAVSNRFRLTLQIAAAVLPYAAFACPARADIFQWEYTNPADPSQGKQQSTTLAPDGAGVDAAPGANLAGRDLAMAYLPGARFFSARNSCGEFGCDYLISVANLSTTNLTRADLTGASLTGATLTGANLTGAEIRSVSFDKAWGQLGHNYGFTLHGTGITLPQLYSTASYQDHDLSGVRFYSNNLAGGNFAGQNLTDAFFESAVLTGADFTGAEIRGASFDGITSAQLYTTASYQARNLTGIQLSVGDMTGWNFAGQNLTNASVGGATLTDAIFKEAQVRGANFGKYISGGTGLSLPQLYSTASYEAHDLSGINLLGNNLAGGNFAGQNLRNASLYGATLTGAVFTGAEIRGASFSTDYYYPLGTGITPAQLYSTASYQSHDLTGTYLSGDLSGGNFAGQNLSNAVFTGATLTNASFHDAILTNTSFAGATLTGVDFSGHDLTNLSFSSATMEHTNFRDTNLTGTNFYDATLTNASFRDANLANSNLYGATLTDADLTGADVHGAQFGIGYGCFEYCDAGGTGISLAQLYSTASYRAKDLSGISLFRHDLTGANFAGQRLTGADFRRASLVGANFAQANLTNVNFAEATLTGADLAAADLRGVGELYAPDAITTNLIAADGHIDGLELVGGGVLIVHDYDGNPSAYPVAIGPIPITVDKHLTIDARSVLRMEFEADAWGSTISFAPGIPVTLGGTLELAFADDVNLASQVGRTFDLFDWTGINPTGAFVVSSPYAWDLSRLYTTGEVTLTAIPEPASVSLAAAAIGVFLLRRPRPRTDGSSCLAAKVCSRQNLRKSSAVSGRCKAAYTHRITCSVIAALALASYTVCAPPTAHAATVRTVALTGQPAPGTPSGANFESFERSVSSACGGCPPKFGGPALNDAGQTAFFARLTGTSVNNANDEGIWSEGSGNLTLVARRGNQAPGMPAGTKFGGIFNTYPGPDHTFEDLSLNNAGQTAFRAYLIRENNIEWDGSQGVWSEGSGSLNPVAWRGAQAPGVASGVTYHSFDSPTLNDAGQTAFWAALAGASVEHSYAQGIWSGSASNVALVAGSDIPAPGTVSGVNFAYLYPPVSNNSGKTAFYGLLTGSDVDLDNDEGIWSNASGHLTQVARAKDQAPGMTGGVTYRFFESPVLNDAGRIAFRTTLSAANENPTDITSIWSDRTGSLALVVRAGDQAADLPSGVNYRFVDSPSLNAAGQLAFRATVAAASDVQGIWSEVRGARALVALEGNHAPGTPDGVNFYVDHSDPLSFILNGLQPNDAGASFSNPILNDAGQAAFSAHLTDHTLGIWATDRNDTVRLIARTGDLLEVAPGDFRTIAYVDLAGATPYGGDFGLRRGFNNRGQLAFWASFTDGTSGIFVSNLVAIPEPTGLVFATAALGVFLMRRRRGLHNSQLALRLNNEIQEINS